MDKYEYNIRKEEILSLIKKDEYAEAARLADTVDWRRVKSVMILCTISDLYKVNRRFEDAREILELAYERHPGGRSILYSLCELSIKLEDYTSAIKYYKEFVQAAPKDNGRYVLQYKLYQAQDYRTEDLIEVLEELCSKDPQEKWSYELAYLYHKIGMGTKCVEQCDELILYFGDGKYVLKAMELKAMHQPLSVDQQIRYNQILEDMQTRAAEKQRKAEEATRAAAEESTAAVVREEQLTAQAVGDSRYDAIHAEKDLAEQMRAIMGPQDEPASVQRPAAEAPAVQAAVIPAAEPATTVIPAEKVAEAQPATASSEEEAEDEVSAAPTMVMPTREIRKALEQEHHDDDTVVMPTEKEIDEAQARMAATGKTTSGVTIVATPANEQAGDGSAESAAPITLAPAPEEAKKAAPAPAASGIGNGMKELSAAMLEGETGIIDLPDDEPEEEPLTTEESKVEEVFFGETTELASAAKIMEAMRLEHEARMATIPSRFDSMLGMDTDGQISLVVQERDQIEKQITGQISLEDVLIEWEKMKRDSEQKRMEAVRERVLKQTGPMFTQFEESIRDGLLEQLEKGAVTMEEAISAAESEGQDPEDALLKKLLEEEDKKAEESDEDAEDDSVEELTDIEEPEDADSEEEGSEDDSENEEESAEDEEAEEEVSEDEEETAGDDSEEEVLEDAEDESEAKKAATSGTEAVESKEKSDSAAEPEEASEESHTAAEPEKAPDASEEDKKDGEEADEAPADAKAKTAAAAAKTAKADTGVKSTTVKKIGKDGKVHVITRKMTAEEEELFGSFAHDSRTRAQIVNAIDNISLASYTGNVILTGEEEAENLTLAQTFFKEIRNTDGNFSGKIGKISVETLAHKGMAETFDKMENGALIIQHAGSMKPDMVSQMLKLLDQENRGLILLLEGSKKSITRLIKNFPEIRKYFTLRIDIAAMDNDALVEIGKEYAKECEYSIDDLGVLALHTCIENRQTGTHVVSSAEVKEIVDEAIRSAKRASIGHFFRILGGKRYDEDDMIIISERDFKKSIEVY